MASYNSRIVGEGESLAEEVGACFMIFSRPALPRGGAKHDSLSLQKPFNMTMRPLALPR